MTKMTTFRLNAFLARSGVASRRKADLLIEEGRVSVNGVSTKDFGTRIDPSKDIVELDGRRIELPNAGVLLLYKPRGVITSMADSQGRPTVADYIPSSYRGYVPVGRLDGDVSGLVILTNDGDLAQHLTHPRYEIPRTYEVKVFGRIREEVIRQVREGVVLEDGPVQAEMTVLNATQQHSLLQLTLHEGRNHLVKRLMAHIGNPVLRLKRLAHGPFSLTDMKLGELREVPHSVYIRTRRALLGTR